MQGEPCYNRRSLAGSAAIHIAHLSLVHFRNYRSLELDLPPGLALLVGGNAQGKSNLLEALFLLATGGSPRSEADREMIGWSAAQEPIPYARVAAQVVSARGRTTLEIVLQLTRGDGGPGDTTKGARPSEATSGPPSAEGPEDVAGGVLQKAFKVNGVRKRAGEVVGILTVVLAGPEEVDLASGPPAGRRRFLDLTNCQLDALYLRALQRYQRVLTQRNALLRQARERSISPAEMVVWDEELVRAGSYLLSRRAETLEVLQEEAGATHAALTGSSSATGPRLDYRCTVGPVGGLSEEEIRQRFLAALEGTRPRDVALGATTVGPHRDDLRLLMGGVDMGVYGSRGQQRTLALALILAQSAYMRRRSGEDPVVLLDDSLSELDVLRRERLVEVCLVPGRQLLLTTTDLGLVPPTVRLGASLFHVRAGQVQPEPL